MSCSHGTARPLLQRALTRRLHTAAAQLRRPPPPARQHKGPLPTTAAGTGTRQRLRLHLRVHRRAQPRRQPGRRSRLLPAVRSSCDADNAKLPPRGRPRPWPAQAPAAFPAEAWYFTLLHGICVSTSSLDFPVHQPQILSFLLILTSCHVL